MDQDSRESSSQSQQDEEALWDLNLRRTIRKQQRDIISDVHRSRDDMSLSKGLMQHVSSLNKLLTDVVGSKEAAIDSEGFRLLSAIGREHVEATHGNLIQFDTATYTEKLVTYMGGRRGAGEHLNWARLGDRAAKAFHKPPSVNFLFGALELEPYKKRQSSGPRKKRDKEEGTSSRPKEVEELTEEEESTTKDVQHVWKYVTKACREKGRVGYLNFLVDPESFARTVENMFHFSFLIKDGRMGVMLGRDGLPYIYIPSETINGQSTKTTKNQTITSLTVKDWKRAIVKFNITTSSIPPRT